MERDRVFSSTSARGSDFEFNTEVAAVFDDMLVRSVPFYVEQHHLILEIAEKFWTEGTTVYDLGCSTATMLVELSKKLGNKARLVGYDNSEPMLERARAKVANAGLRERVEVRMADLNADLSQMPLDNAGIVTLCWTLQFVRPLKRDPLIRKIYENLVDGGVLIVTEKILTNSSHMNRFFIEFYYDFKSRNGYSEEEILRKREALENVLVPYRVDENFEMFRRNGFEITETFFQWYNFAGFLCVKKLL
jgi:tRNA (cmo5U34)-methyltransferase